MNPAAIARKANKKISQYGQRMEFVRETEGPTNPETMQPDIEQVVTSFMGMWDSPKVQEIGNLVQQDDSVFCSAGNASPAPDSTDWIRREITSAEKEAWDVIYVEATKPGTVPIMYKIFVRNAGGATGYSRTAA